MAKEVVIKSNKYGMELILEDKLPFSELLQIIGEKFKESGNFFKDAKMAVSFAGRKLTEEEELQIVDTIMENSSINIICIMDKESRQEEQMKERVEVLGAGPSGSSKGNSPRLKKSQLPLQEAPQSNAESGFYKGNLRSGQVLECPTSVTLIGDVNPGARIVSGGNVVVLGALKGNACAGVAGNNSCFIFALDMQPIQLQIGEVIAKSPDREKTEKHLFKKERSASAIYSPQIAIARNGSIYVEPMTKGCLDKL